MRILYCVEFYHPSVGGMQSVARALAERLARRGHDVTVATSYHPRREAELLNRVTVRSFRISGNLVHGLQGEVERYRSFLRRERFDVVVLLMAQQWATDLALELLPELRARVVFVPTGFSGLSDPAYAGYFARMPGWLRAVDANVFLSEGYQDVAFARAHGARNVRLITNGANEEEFGAPSATDVRAVLGIPRSSTLVLNVGSFTGAKGQPEAIEIFSRARLRDATLLVVGDASPPPLAPTNPKVFRRCRLQARLHRLSPARLLDRTAVRVLGLDRETTVAAFQAADLFLFTSNIECSPIVLFEAAASGTPFLSTDVGNAREIVRWTGAGELLATKPREKGWVTPDVDAAAVQLRRLVADPARRRAMGEAGRRAWRERFTWDAIARQYEALYTELCAEEAAARPA